jgi:hypothetical protein
MGVWDLASERARLKYFAKAVLLSTPVILIAFASRLLLMSNYDTSTAATIASSTGISGTIMGTLIPLLPPFLPVIFIFLVAWRRLALAILAGIATALISPAYVQLSDAWQTAWASADMGWQLILDGKWQIIWHEWRLAVLVAGVGATIALMDPPPWAYRLLPRRERTERGEWRRRRLPWLPAAVAFHGIARLLVALVIAAVGALTVLASAEIFRVPHESDTLFYIMRRPWVPAEEITLESGETLVGYTLSTSDGWFVLLLEEDRRIRYVPADDVAERSVCAMPGDDEFLGNTERLPLRHPPEMQEPPPRDDTCKV